MIKQGNSYIDSVQNRGWLIGKFNPKATIENENFEFKISHHIKGDKRSIEDASSDPERDTISILMSGKFKLIFPEDAREIILREEADYAHYSKNTQHAWECLEDCTMVTLRFITD